MRKKLVDDIREKARKISDDEDKLGSLIKHVVKKLGELSQNVNLQKLINSVELMVKMVKSYYNGEYRSYPKRTLLFILFGLIYFLIPIDTIPDFIPVYGFIDDLTVILWVFKSIQKDIIAYQEWEKQKLPS